MPIDSFYIPNAQRVGQAGVDDAIKKGTLRPATDQDFIRWTEAYIQSREAASKKELFPTAEKRQYHKDKMIIQFQGDRQYAYVIIDENFTYPVGLSMPYAFLIDESVSPPKDDHAASVIFDSQGNCLTTNCLLFVHLVDDSSGVDIAPPYDALWD